MQSLSMTTQQWDGDIIPESGKVADGYDESMLSYAFTDGVDLSVQHKFRSYWAMHLHTNLVDMAFQAGSFFAIQNGPVTSRQTISIKPDRRNRILASR